MRDFGYEAQLAAQQHLQAVEEAMYTAMDLEDADPVAAEAVTCDSPAVGPYCGCETCVIRETLAGAWPTIEDYVADAVSGPMNALVGLVAAIAVGPREDLTIDVLTAMVEAEKYVEVTLNKGASR